MASPGRWSTNVWWPINVEEATSHRSARPLISGLRNLDSWQHRLTCIGPSNWGLTTFRAHRRPALACQRIRGARGGELEQSCPNRSRRPIRTLAAAGKPCGGSIALSVELGSTRDGLRQKNDPFKQFEELRILCACSAINGLN